MELRSWGEAARNAIIQGKISEDNICDHILALEKTKLLFDNEDERDDQLTSSSTSSHSSSEQFRELHRKINRLLVLCAVHNRKKIFHYLLDHGADLKAKVGSRRTTALHQACIHERLEFLQDILKQDKSVVHLKDALGRTPLLVAACNTTNKTVDIVLMLLDAGANINEQSLQGITALMAAVDAGNEEVVELLLLHKRINVRLRDGKGASVLQYAVKKGNLTFCKWLLDHEPLEVMQTTNDNDKKKNPKLTANDKNEKDISVLMIAVNHNHVDVCKLLIDRGASLTHKSKNGVDAFDCVRDKEMYHFLSTYSEERDRAHRESSKTELDKPLQRTKPDSITHNNEKTNFATSTLARTSSNTIAERKKAERVSKDDIPEKELCVVCLENRKDATIVHGDSGHMATCFACARILQRRGDPCPICRASIEHVIRQFNC
eukprot:g3352.t1